MFNKWFMTLLYGGVPVSPTYIYTISLRTISSLSSIIMMLCNIFTHCPSVLFACKQSSCSWGGWVDKLVGFFGELECLWWLTPFCKLLPVVPWIVPLVYLTDVLCSVEFLKCYARWVIALYTSASKVHDLYILGSLYSRCSFLSNSSILFSCSSIMYFL